MLFATCSECYVSDWTDGFKAHVHILAPSTYIFFASVIPALTFGEQLADETGGQVVSLIWSHEPHE